jgi:hypothetical protein
MALRTSASVTARQRVTSSCMMDGALASSENSCCGSSTPACRMMRRFKRGKIVCACDATAGAGPAPGARAEAAPTAAPLNPPDATGSRLPAAPAAPEEEEARRVATVRAAAAAAADRAALRAVDAAAAAAAASY